MPTNQNGRDILSDQDWEQVGRGLGLSPREFELLRCCFDDLSEAEMADSLGISPHTVHTYMRRIFRKTGARSRVQLVVCSVAEILRERESRDGIRL